MAATATALVVGRLDSTLLGVPQWAIITLYIYAAIQPTFDILIGGKAINKNSVIPIAKVLLVYVALISKVLFFAIIHWLAKTGRLLYFMVQSYTLYEKAKMKRLKFIEK